MTNLKFYLLTLLLSIATVAMAGPKLEKIKLTGTVNEDVEMTVGNSGRTEIISSLPYEFKVAKNDLPIKLTFRSSNYEYVDIILPKKPVDGHIYLLKGEKRQTAMHNGYTPAIQQIEADENKPIVGIDVTKGVNNAPYTGRKSENTFALIIANENYEMVEKVDMATNDGLAVKEYCTKTLGLGERQILYYPDATYGKMRKAVRDLKSIAAAFNGDINLIVYYAGHGIPDNATKDAYIMPVDADGTDTGVCYSLKNLYKEIDEMELNQTVVFLDACFSGSKRDGDMIVEARSVVIKPQEEKPTGSTIVFSATSDKETAFSYDDEKHGLFTYFLLKKIQESKGDMSLGDLADYVKEHVPAQSILINGSKQTPTIMIPDNMADSWRKMKLAGKK